MKSLRETINDLKQDDYEFEDQDQNNNEDDEYESEHDQYNYSDNDDNDNENDKLTKDKITKKLYSRTLGRSLYGRNKIKELNKMPSIYLNCPEIKLYSKSQMNQYAPGQLSNIKFYQKHPYHMNQSKHNLEFQLKEEILEVLLQECYYSKDFYAMGLLVSKIVEVMPLHLSKLIKISDLLCNIPNNKATIKLLAQKSLPSQRSARITDYRKIEISKELLVLFVELFVSNDLIDDCLLFLRSQMSNPVISSSDVYFYYQTMLKLLKIIPHSNLGNIIRNPIMIFKSLEENNSVLGSSSQVMDMQEESDSSSDESIEDTNNNRKKARSVSNREIERSGIHSMDSDDVHFSLEKLAIKNHNCIILNTFYIASLYSKKEHKKAMKYLKDMQSEGVDEDIKSQFTRLLLQYYALLILEGDYSNEIMNQVLDLASSFFSKGQHDTNVQPHFIYCCVLLHKLDYRLPKISLGRLFSVVCNAVEILPSLYSGDLTPGCCHYSRHLWRILANTLGPLSNTNPISFDKNFEPPSYSSVNKSFLDQFMYWNSTILTCDDEYEPYPTIFEIRFLANYLNGEKVTNESMIERMKNSFDFLNPNDSVVMDNNKYYFEELMMIISDVNSKSHPYLTFKGDLNSNDLNFSITKKSFKSFSSEIWNQEKKQEKKIQENYPFFSLGDGYLEILSFQIVVSSWINLQADSSFALKGIQTIVQHAYLENKGGNSAGPAHYCLKYLKDMNIDVMTCVQKAFYRSIESQDTSNGILLSILSNPVFNNMDDRVWVQCDSCNKWRALPSTINASSLPDQWYCSLNTYDRQRNDCNAPEEVWIANPNNPTNPNNATITNDKYNNNDNNNNNNIPNFPQFKSYGSYYIPK